MTSEMVTNVNEESPMIVAWCDHTVTDTVEVTGSTSSLQQGGSGPKTCFRSEQMQA